MAATERRIVMQRQPVSEAQRQRIVASLPFVEALARRVASSMPSSIDLGDLVQDGMIGLIDAAHRFDDGRGIKFETFAERRVRGAMIDALRRDAWPRGVRRMRRQLVAAREDLRRELGHEPTLADLAARMGADASRLGRTILRISTIESTSPLASNEGAEEGTLPPVLAPPEAPLPDRLYEDAEVRQRVRAAVAALPPRERTVVGLYYFGEATMRQIGAAIGVNESRVSQLHARAVQRLKRILAATDGPPAPQAALLCFPSAPSPRMVRARLRASASGGGVCAETRDGAVVLDHPSTSRASRNSSASLNGLGSHRQPLSSRKRSASVPATSPVTNMIRRARAGELSAMAR
jgi:RNA polymerase sigma factor for flagellar operon FliA